MDFSKVFGWFLLIAGVILIGWTLRSSYDIYTGKALAPEFFAMTEKEAVTQTGTLTVEEQMQALLKEQLSEILPEGTMTKMMNLIVWSFLAFILLSGGGQIAGLGIKLVRK